MFPFTWSDPDCVDRAIRRGRYATVSHCHHLLLANRFNHLSPSNRIWLYHKACHLCARTTPFRKKAPITDFFQDDDRDISPSRWFCILSICVIFIHSRDSPMIVSTHAVKEIVFPLLSSHSSSSNRCLAMKIKKRGEGDHDENVALCWFRWEPKLLEEFSSTLEEIASSSIRESRNEDRLRLDFSLNLERSLSRFWQLYSRLSGNRVNDSFDSSSLLVLISSASMNNTLSLDAIEYLHATCLL